MKEFVEENHFGNLQFKYRLKEELRKYRLFNKTGFQPIFSVFICGSSGTGKTEIARLLHNALYPKEPMIKINFGNYGAKDALSSLIGSPRGYIGSNKGELTEKISKSESRVISPELRSRFSYRVSFDLLDLETKKKYLVFKYEKMIKQIEETVEVEITGEVRNKILNIKCEDYNNIRELNAVLINNIANELYENIVLQFE